jgi:hypothetical protein
LDRTHSYQRDWESLAAESGISLPANLATSPTSNYANPALWSDCDHNGYTLFEELLQRVAEDVECPVGLLD